MSFIKKLFGKKEEEVETSSNYLIATLNERIGPLDRGEIYEDPLDEFLKSKNLGEITGGGTMQFKSGELEYCDIEIELLPNQINPNTIQEIITRLEELGAPKGSKLTVEKTNEKIPFGKKEGLAIYLDGVNLDQEVYQSCDSNIVVSEVKKLTNDTSELVRFWEGQEETAIYFYSDTSFSEMKNSITNFLNEYPLCKGARIEKIA